MFQIAVELMSTRTYPENNNISKFQYTIWRNNERLI